MENLKRAVFLDRDGVINEDFLFNKKLELEMFPGTANAIKKLNGLGFLVIIITNQPQVAKGIHREKDVRRINRKLLKELRDEGGQIDAIYYCPHHPEQRSDIPDWAKKYRVTCGCRKPATGLLERAGKKFGIDMSSSYFIGDRTVDVQCGKNAGTRTILVETGYAGSDKKFSVEPDYRCKDLLSAASLIEKMECSTAVMLAGGRGERLRPLTDNLPKPMLPVAGKPVLLHQIELLKKHGISSVVVCGHYLFSKIRDYFGDGKTFGVDITYVEEKEPLGTGGAIKNVERLIKNRFIVLYGDEMLDVDVRKLLAFHSKNKGVATIVLHETTHPEDSDLVVIDRRGRIRKLIPKPHGRVKTNLSKSSLYVFEPAVFRFLRQKGGFEASLNEMIKTNAIFGYVTDEYIKDMGTIKRYEDVRKRYERTGESSKGA